MTLNIGTNAMTSWDFNLKNLSTVKPGTRKVKTKAANRAMWIEMNDVRINDDNDAEMSTCFCKAAEFTILLIPFAS